MPKGLTSALTLVAAKVESKAAPIAAAKGDLFIDFILTPEIIINIRPLLMSNGAIIPKTT